MSTLTQQQVVALLDELESATKLIDLGVGELHKIDGANDYYHLPLQLLSQGLERFLKLTYVMAQIGSKGSPPTLRRMSRHYGHELLPLTEDLVNLVEQSAEYATRPAVQDDIDFIRSDRDLRRVLEMLSAFGKEGRYHRLDELLGAASADSDSDPYRRWAAFELEVVQRHEDWPERGGSVEDSADLHRDIATYIAGRVDRFARAIARMWTLGALPGEARRYSGLLKPFLFLRDEALGARRD
jgi:hypothetical protein